MAPCSTYADDTRFHHQKSAQNQKPLKILLVAGSPEQVSQELLKQLAHEHDLIIACDSALDICMAAQVTPHIAVGDFDSVDENVLKAFSDATTEIITSHWHKDATDIGMAFELIDERYYRPRQQDDDKTAPPLAQIEMNPQVAQTCCPPVTQTEANPKAAPTCPSVTVTLTSSTGGRLDHQLALIGKMVEFAHLYPSVREDSMSAYILHADHRSAYTTSPDHQFKTASAIALTARTELSLSGFEWNLDHAWFTLLDQGDLAGTSNIIRETRACVEVHHGALIFIVNELREDKKLHDLGISR